MSLSLQLGFPDVPRSITNPNVKKQDALDIGTPLTFLDFIKIINVSFEPDNLQNYYNFYIKTWNDYNLYKDKSSKNLIIEKYKEFLKDVIIKFSTLEEKKYLSTIDFNDPFDLDIALGFYSKKLKEICLFYNSKRNNVKFGFTKNRLRGTNFVTEKTIKELVLSYIQNIEDSNMIFDLDTVRSKIEIEIEELYNTYPLYNNQLPDEKIYDNKDLDYGLNIFLRNDEDLINDVFSGLSEELKSIKEVDQLFENKRELTKKYMGTDFYYLSTGPTVNDMSYGILFENDNTVLNFLNRNYPTTASTARKEFENSMDRGFFKPTNTSFILINGTQKDFTIVKDKLSPNSLYFFPDPNIFGNDLGILEFTVDDYKSKKNSTSGLIKNHPTTNQYDTKYYGYTSKIDPNTRKYLDAVFNSGYIKEFKTDIFNNSYGLLKEGFNKYIKNIDISDDIVYNVLITGYSFHDSYLFYNEGYEFDYYVIDDTTYTETTRTGLSSNTLNFTNFTPDVKLSFGKFKPYYELIEPSDSNLVKTYRYIDGGFITRPNLTPYPDSVSSDLSAFEYSTDSFYYNTLIDGGIYDNNPLQRALLDPLYPSLSANFTIFEKTSTFNTVDCGYFSENIPEFYDVLNYKIFINTSNNCTQLLSPSSFNSLNGVLMIKNTSTKEILPLMECLPYIQFRYNNIIISELDNILTFDSVFDSIMIESENYFIIEKINFSDGVFQDPKNTIIYLTHNQTPYNKISNRFKVDNIVYYCLLDSVGSSYNNDLIIYPHIYAFDVVNFKNTKLFPRNNTDLEYFRLSSDIITTSVETPIISYSKYNNIFNISFLTYDQNHFPTLYNLNFSSTPDVSFISKESYILDNTRNTNIFVDYMPSTLSIFLSSTIQISNDELTI
jgi:hypothetical protein